MSRDLALESQRTLVTIDGVRPVRPTPRDIALGVTYFTEEERKALAEEVKKLTGAAAEAWTRLLQHYLFVP